MGLLSREVDFCVFVITGAPEGSTRRLVFVGLLSRESTRRLNREVGFCCCFWRSPGSNLRPLVYKAE